MKKILVLHGPNLNLLGQREPDVYGTTTLAEINALLINKATKAGLSLEHLQSNAESELIDAIHRASGRVQYLIINAGAFTHTSIALRDALAGVGIPFIEVHLSNIYKREPFRRQSLLAELAEGVICGFGVNSYTLALDFILNHHNIKG